MGSLPDSKYIIKADGYWFVEAHDVDPSKGFISVSAKGIVNGLSNQPNDGCDFGPDTYNPSYSGSGIPYTQTSGIQEAIDYAVNVGGTTIQLLEGIFDVTDAPFQSDVGTYGGEFSTAQILIPVTPSQSTIKIRILGQGIVSGLEEKVLLDSVSGGTVIKSYAATQTVGNPPYASYIMASERNSLNTATGQNYVDVYFDGITFLTSADSNVGGFNGFSVINCSGGQISAISNIALQPTTLNANPRGAFILSHSSEGQADIDFQLVKVEGYTNGLNMGSHLHIGKYVTMYNANAIYIDANNGNPFTVLIDYFDIQMTGIFVNTEATGGISVLVGVFGIGDQETSSTYPYYYQYVVKSVGLSSIAGIIGSKGISPINVDITSTDMVRLKAMPNILSELAPTISPNPPVSGTAYQNTNPYDILIYLPVYTSTSGTAGNVKASIGPTSTPATQVVNDIVNSGTSSTNPRTIILKVPAGWYYEFTGTTATFGTAIVVAD